LRVAILAIGIVLLIVGIVLVLVPVEPQSVPVNELNPRYSPNMTATLQSLQVFSPLASQTFQITWSSNIMTNMEIKTCPPPPSLGSCTLADFKNGLSGTVVITARSGDYIVAIVNPETSILPVVNVTARSSMPLIGLALVAAGMILLIAATVIIIRGKPAPPEPSFPDGSGPVPPEPPHLPPPRADQTDPPRP
jgi:uncharacterized protein YjeT (DUF2065 family)